MFPSNLKPLILKSFAHPSKPYGQVVTTQKNGVPDIRTVHFQYFDETSTFAFSTHMQSRKWKDLEKNPILTGCWWDEPNQVQWTWKAHAQLVTSQSTEHQAILQTMWLRMREEVRLTYLLYAENKSLENEVTSFPNLHERSPHHVGIIFSPFEWDVYQFSPQGFRFGNRRIFKKIDSTWQEQRVCILNSLPQ